MIAFEVLGKPATQGSKKVVPIYSKSGPVMKNGRVLTRAINDNPKLSDWRQQVAVAAREAYHGGLLTGAIILTLQYEQPRPQSHYGSGKNADKLKPTAPVYPITKPDTVKLARAVEDALTGVLWRDDSMIVEHHLCKRYGPYFKLYVLVREMAENPDNPRIFSKSPSQVGGSNGSCRELKTQPLPFVEQ
jgi:Holliday junction resolvase RusA-like endonuclease